MKTVGFLIVDDRKLTAEEKAAWAFLSKVKSVRSERIHFDDFLRRPQRFDLLWWHFDESTSLPSITKDPKIVSALRDHIWSGNGFLLSLLASSYVVELGLETKLPNVRVAGTWSESSPIAGYPDIRGFAGFGKHPIFNGFAGGLYTWSPGVGDRFSAAMYEDETPVSGRVVAVENSYIRLNESRRIICEYGDTKGRVLSIGAHLYFADQRQRFRCHLEKFTASCLTYLSMHRVPESKSTRRYWNFDPPTVAEFVHTSRSTRKSNLRLPRQSDDLVSYRDLATAEKDGEMFALSGRRVLVMGKENAGIAEVWTHPIRILKDLKVGFRIGDFPFRSETEISPVIAIRPESVTRKFSLNGNTIEETIFTDLIYPAGAVHYQINSEHPVQIFLRARIDLRYMWPLSEHATGSLRFAWDHNLRAALITDSEGRASAVVGVSATPTEHLVGQFSDISFQGESLTASPASSTEVMIGLRISLPPGKGVCAIVFSGSGESVQEAVQCYRAVMRRPAASLMSQRKQHKTLEKNCAGISTPDEQFNKGYRWALAGLDKFCVETPGLGSSLMAGYGFSTSGWDGGHAVSGRPGYAWYFGRDSVWTSLALLDCGDHEKVRSVLEFLGRYQDADGKILHEMTSSGYAHYDAADSTPLYLYLMGRYVRATGDRAFARREFPKVRKAVQYCFSTDTDGDHFIENTNSGHGWVEGGQLFPAHAEHYLVSCWAAALTESSFVAGLTGDRRLSARWRRDARVVLKNLQKQFWNPKTRFYNFAKLADGSFNAEKTILPTVGMYLGCADRNKSQESLMEYASDSFTADWGVRIISQSSPLFNPSGYHYGSIWPLFSGWTALAEFALGRPIQGYMHLMSNLRLHDQFSHGSFEEVLHGQLFEPQGVCAHQAWSDSMAIQPIFEGMLGLKVDAMSRIIELSPYIPPDWDNFSVRGIRAGEQRFGMSIQRLEGETVYTLVPERKRVRPKGIRAFRLKFTPILPLGTRVTEMRIGSKTHQVNAVVRDYSSLGSLHIRFDKRIVVRVKHFGGISIIPPLPHLHRGQESTGLHILDEKWNGKTYSIIVEGQRGREYLLDVKDHSLTVKSVEGAPVLSHDGDRLILVVQFKGDTEGRTYERREIRFTT